MADHLDRALPGDAATVNWVTKPPGPRHQGVREQRHYGSHNSKGPPQDAGMAPVDHNPEKADTQGRARTSISGEGHTSLRPMRETLIPL
jgi:hypothetical protein